MCKKCGFVEREGMGCVWSSIPVAIFKVRQQPQQYYLYAFHIQFNHDHSKQQEEKKQEEKKDNKKAS